MMGGRGPRDDLTPVERLRGLLDNVRASGGGFTARCPGHEDRYNSLKVDEGDGGEALIHCHTGCPPERVMVALGLRMADLFPQPEPKRGGAAGAVPYDACATAERPAGCTLAAYAAAKKLPVEALRSFGLSEMFYGGSPAIRIPYRNADGTDAAVRFRVRLEKTDAGDDRFKWKSGAKPCLYGRDRLALARERGYVVVVEGESDCHTGWHHGEPVVGVPGANTWRDDRDAPELDGIPIVYLVVEPDRGGETLKQKTAASSIRDRVRLVDLGAHKDLSGLYLADPDRFQERWAAALAAAVPLAEELEAEADAAKAEAWAACEAIATDPDIPARAALALAASGVAGEARTLMLLFLILVSRFLSRPVSASVKGPSSGGKSHLVERVSALFPADAVYALTAMSEKALVYDDEPLAHRFLILYEAGGMSGDFASYLVRSLLSEGQVRYVTVEKTKDGLRSRLIERPGPTGLLLTTTAVHLHPENETRMLSLGVTDTPEQTRAIFKALAHGAPEPLDPAPWHALQTWLAGAEHRVAVPFAGTLAELVPPTAVRLRRDFGTLLTLIRANALLHQATRERDAEGAVVATVADYEAVRALVADLIAEGVEATVPTTVRETVVAARGILAPAADLAGKVREGRDDERTCAVVAVAAALKIDKSAASRRVRVAIDRGYLRNLEDKKGRPARIALGDPLPEDAPILPEPAALVDGCTVAGGTEGIPDPPPPTVEPTPVRGEGGDTPGRTAATVQPPIDGVEPDPTIEGWAAELATFTDGELARYREELASAPADDPPSAKEWAALALAERLRAEAA
ncbi:MAG: hypothetical protein M3Q10_07905 [Chloroflexota bacterium]|nr:hypothetical protein [Chloroflexota bacterium]